MANESYNALVSLLGSILEAEQTYSVTLIPLMPLDFEVLVFPALHLSPIKRSFEARQLHSSPHQLADQIEFALP